MWDDPDRAGVFVHDNELAVGLVLDDEPVVRGEARLSEPDLLGPRGLLAVLHNVLLSNRPGMW